MQADRNTPAALSAQLAGVNNEIEQLIAERVNNRETPNYRALVNLESALLRRRASVLAVSK